MGFYRSIYSKNDGKNNRQQDERADTNPDDATYSPGIQVLIGYFRESLRVLQISLAGSRGQYHRQNTEYQPDDPVAPTTALLKQALPWHSVSLSFLRQNLP